ncbi:MULTISPECIES: ATP-grasp domain-containing protein [unclassified Streptomyces]|uniref:ATP-grasp domain-containing protein n=1 Tax=unclassified Streptomyces TaxID=2593676 RepID=UPI00331C91A9
MPGPTPSRPLARPRQDGTAPGHIVVLHRWSDRYADYARYLDHTAHQVSYVTTERALTHLPLDGAAGVELVDSTENAKAVREAVDRLAERCGPPTRVVALQETDLDLAAALRDELSLPGPGTEELRPVRDKLLMARRLAAHAVPAPATAGAPGHAAVSRFAAAHGWPVLVKPRRGTASAHVTRLNSPRELAAYVFPAGTDMIVQPWVPDRILHVDGVFDGRDLGFWRASRYVSNCLEFTSGEALGSVEIDDGAALERIGALTARAARALLARPSVFHLELFESESGALAVLELGARPGGAEVPFVWREVHGVDLMAAAFAHQTDTPDPTPAAPSRTDRIGGWLLVPPSVPAPCRVRSVTLPDDGPAYAHRVPYRGQLMTGGGYEHAGARFRFAGRSSAEVEAALLRTARGTALVCTPVDERAPARVAVVGCGNPPYRRYALAALAERVETALVQPGPPRWQRPYVEGRFRAADTADADAVTEAVADLLASADGAGAILTWDETLLATTAQAARRLNLPHLGPEAVRGCRDKLTTRRTLAAAGVPSAAFRHVHGRAEAIAAAAELGLPVVVKPRGLAGSIGVTLADTPEAVGRAFDRATTAAFPGIDRLAGAIVEEYLTGPEISVDCAVDGGRVHLVNVARKRLGFAPHFEEVGHLVAPWRHEPWACDVESVVTAAHTALGLRTGITHSELRLTPSGPRVVEVNGRLGGDFVPLLGRLATGVDQVAAAADLALGRTPDVTPRHERCAEVRFVYPAHDAVVHELDVTAAAAVPGIADAVALAPPGTELRLPPHGIVPRLAALIATGDRPEECRTALDTAERAVRHRLAPLPH